MSESQQIGVVIGAGAHAVRCASRSSCDGSPVPQVGDLVAIGEGPQYSVGIVSVIGAFGSQSNAPTHADFDVEMVGRLTTDEKGALAFTRGMAVAPTMGSEVFKAGAAAMAAIFPTAAPTSVTIGSILQLQGREFSVEIDALLATHFAVFGATGSGKTSGMVAMLRAIGGKMPHARIVILDPHGEYREAFGDWARVFDWRSLRLPYWLLRFRELASLFNLSPEADHPAEIKILHDGVLTARRKFAGEKTPRIDQSQGQGLDIPFPYRLSDLRAAIAERMGELMRAEPAPSYLRVLNRLEQLTQDERFAFMFSAGYMRDMLGEVIAQFLPSDADGPSVSILDLSEVPDDALDVIVAAVARILLSLSTWASADGGVPTLLVCEEAGRYMSAMHQVERRIGHEALAQIAREGRKFGVSLAVVSQRPSQLSEEIVSQCGSAFVLRTSNARDLDYVGRALPDTALRVMEAMPALPAGEAIAFGQAAPFPIRFQFHRLAEAVAPAPKARRFSLAWTTQGPGEDVIARAISRWREHGHLFHR